MTTASSAMDVQGSTMSDTRIFSDDEVENKFMDDITWVSPDHWLRTEMPWNTIHGKLWERDIQLGSGAYGTVCVGHRVTDSKYFAVKSIVIEYPMTPHVQCRIETQINEIYMMRFLRSKYIPRCFGCGRSNGNNGLYGRESMDVFMEFAPMGSLRSIYNERLQADWMTQMGAGTFDENNFVRHYTHDLLKALQYVHSKRIVHGDIKMANVLMSDTSVMLADWGGAKQLSRDLSNLKKFLIGTTGFKSPEVLTNYQQSYPSDIFSLGCTVIEMFTGNFPEQIQEHVTGFNQFFESRTTDVPGIVIPDHMSDICKDFLKLCLCQKLEDRWTAQELLHHPFITDRDKDNKYPYSFTLDPAYRASILKPPRCRMDPELDDGQPTWRVSAHLRQVYGRNQPWFLCRLPTGFAPTNPSQVQVPARLVSIDVDFAKPFPIRVPDFYEKKSRNDEANFISHSSSHTVTESRGYAEPFDLERVEVNKPGELKPEQRANNATISPVNIVPQPAELQHFHDTMIANLEILVDTNTAIFKEAREEAEKKDPEFLASEGDLFPELKRLIPFESGQASSGLNMFRKLGLSCQGDQAVEVRESMSLPSLSPKGKRKADGWETF